MRVDRYYIEDIAFYVMYNYIKSNSINYPACVKYHNLAIKRYEMIFNKSKNKSNRALINTQLLRMDEYKKHYKQ